MKGLPGNRLSVSLSPPWRRAALAGAGLAGLTALVIGSDRLLERIYESWRPRLERQVGRIMGRPLRLGPYQGIGPDGLRVGASSFLPGPQDGSTAAVRSLRLLVNPLASWQRRQLVLDFSLTGARADLRPNREGQVWVLGQLPPGGEPPPIELHFRLLKPGDLALHGLGSQPAPLRLKMAGQVGVLPRQRRLDGRVRTWLPGTAGSALLTGGGSWKQRLWGIDVVAEQLSLEPLLRWLPRSVKLEGRTDGRLRLGLDQGRFRCNGTLQVRGVRWRQSGLTGPIEGERLPVSCADSRLTVASSPWRYGRWGGQVSAVLNGDRSLAVRLRARPPASAGRPVGDLRALLRGRWQEGALRGTRVDLETGASRLQAQGTLGRAVDLAGWWRLDPADLPALQRLPDWLGRQPIAGRFSLSGPLGSPELQIATRLHAQPLVGPLEASLQWSRGQLVLQRLEAAHLSARATLPLRSHQGRGLEAGALEAWVDLRDFPLASLGPLLGTRLQGRLDARGSLRGPLSALVPDLSLAVRNPAAGPLGLQESWSGRLQGTGGGGGLLLLEALNPGLDGKISARLDRRWLPTQVELERNGGTLTLNGAPRLYHWQASGLPLHGLELLLPGARPPQPLAGLLTGRGQLGLQPLAVNGRVELQKPGFFGLGGRSLTADLRYSTRQYALRGTVQPLSGGTIDAELSGQWRGPFHARFQARGLSSLLFQEMARAWDRWRGLPVPSRGRAGDLGEPAIATLGMTLQDQIAALDAARERLQAWEEQQQRASRAERLARLQMRVDADLVLQGPDLRRARADLDGRGHLWLSQEDRDLSLARDPFTVRLEGPLSAGGGSFSISGLTLSLLSLLTPVPDSLRGYLSVTGRYRLGRRRPELALELSLDQAALAGRGLRLERGLLELEDKGLQMDLALQAEGASSTVDLSGLLPLEASSDALELRLASRGDGLRFLTDLVGRAITWRKGSVDLRLLVRGSLLDPIANGFLRFREGEYDFIGQTLQGVEATVLFDFQQLLVQELRARVGRHGRLSGEGRLGLVRPLADAPSLALQLKEVPFSLERIKAVANGRLELGGSLAEPVLGGRVAISHGVINAQPGQLARVETRAGQATPAAPATPAGPDAPGQPRAGTSPSRVSAANPGPGAGSAALAMAPAKQAGSRSRRLAAAAAAPTPSAETSAAPASAPQAPPTQPAPPPASGSSTDRGRAGSGGGGGGGGGAVQPTSMNELLQRQWDFRQPLLLLGPDVESTTNLSLQEAIPNLPWLRFENLRLAFGPELRMVIPNIANFTTGGALRISGRLDPSLRASGVVRLLKGRLNLFTTTFSLDPDAPNVAVFTPSLGLVPYLDIALRTRIANNLTTLAPSGVGESGLQVLPGPGERDSRGGFSSFSQLNLILVTVSVSGPADRIADNLRLRSSPPLPQERLVALIGGNSLAGLQGGQAGTALATALGQSLLSPLLASLSDALGQRVSLALYPTYVNQAVASGQERFSGRVPPQLVLAGEVGLDITERLNASVLAAPNRSDVPAQINLNYKASNTWNIGVSVDTQGAWQSVLQFFLRF
jgi:translocation and assembly module TamB